MHMLNHASLGSTCATTRVVSSMHSYHAWVLLEKILSSDFLLLKNLGCYTRPRRRMDALPVPRETMQQKVGRRDATPDLLLKHQNTTVATYV